MDPQTRGVRTVEVTVNEKWTVDANSCVLPRPFLAAERVEGETETAAETEGSEEWS